MPARTLAAIQSSKQSQQTAQAAMGSTPRGTAEQIPCVLWVRVSDKGQEEEGFSMPAQARLLRDYAARLDFRIMAEFEYVETSKISGQRGFNEMVAFLKKHPSCRTILVEKTDRMYRNIGNWAILEELGVTIHFVKENDIIGPQSRSSDKFVHGIKVLMARNYSLNLGEETVKGMTEKARSGIYPSYAPAGYRNAEGPSGKRILIPDPNTAHVITELFDHFAAGQYSVKSLATKFRLENRTLGGRRLNPSLIHQILRKRLYMGDFDWNGVTYQGTQEPLVTGECWQRVQELLDARAENKTRRVKHDFAFTGLLHCGHCGCHFVGELKKRRYVYYHCTGNRGKCPEPYTRQEVLTGEFASILRELVIPEPILEWLTDNVLESDRTEQAAREQTIRRLQAERERIETRIETMYVDKLEGRITQEFFDRRAAEWRREQDAVLRKIQDIQVSAPAPVDQAIDALRLTSQACELFLQQPAAEQRRLLQMLIKHAAWQNGALRTTLFEPFEILRHSNQESRRKETENSGSGQDLQIWLLR